MPHTLLSTGYEGRNQEDHAMVGAKDDILSSLCRHQASATRNKMNAPVYLSYGAKFGYRYAVFLRIGKNFGK